ncbi:hypothetical protein GCM10009087_18200 [Sphingomonas oligophenolica]|uniref:S-layer family protein n=1 Tax=Sphingomonas oligophenolica TaxID=301154 RepID=A0ABU9Y3D5_9SPHN
MTIILSKHRPAARHLFLGSATMVLAAILASPGAQAQVTGVQSTASQALVSDQTERGATNIADGSDALVTIATAGTVAGSTATLSDNAVSATTRGNKVTLNLAPDVGNSAASIQPTHLEAGSAGVAAGADSVIAASQRNQGTVNGALLDGSRVTLDAGAVSDGALAVEHNSQETIALGNDSSAGLALTGRNAGGAGIVSLQSGNGAVDETDDASPVGAHSYGQTALGAGAVSGSTLSLSGNLERAIGYGNAAANALSVQAVGVAPGADGGPASMVPGLAADAATVDAGYGVLSSQVLGAAVKARAGESGTGPAFAAAIAGELTGSSLANDGNTLAAGGYGNQSANGVYIAAVSIARATGSGDGSTGAVANVTGVQRLGDDGRVIASTYGGAVTAIAGNVDASTVSASQNAIQTLAAGNRAGGNLLNVKADSIDTAGDTPSHTVGTALVGADGTATTTAALSVQNVQDSGDVAISAGQRGGRTELIIGGAVSGSVLTANSNAARVSATRNDATNAVTIAATDMRTSADLNNFQVGSGSLIASLGSIADPGGAVIALSGPVTGSSLTVSGNSLDGAATGNSAANTLTATGVTIADGSGHDKAEAGLLADGIGAAATFALANQQQFGVPESGIATPLVSQVAGRFAAAAQSGAQSSLAVDDNMQQSIALGSTAVNRLAITATDLGDDQSPAPGSALSSLQFGSASVVASSAMDLAAKGTGDKASLSLIGNANQASAAINQADNGLSVAAIKADDMSGGTGPVLAALGPVNATGNHVLMNWQVATGRSDAIAATRLLTGGAGDVDRSDVSIGNNSTSADAAANRALNSVSPAAVSGDVPTVGLVSNQRSSADVSAKATTNAALVGTDAAGLTDIGGSSVALNGNATTSLARGNVADNALTLSGTGAPAPTPAGAIAGNAASAQAGATLLNVQANSGTISSSAAWTSYAIPLNAGSATVSGSSVGVTGNTVSAAAYGNAANNVITATSLGGMPGVALASSQVNSGAVSAQVTGAADRLLSSAVSGGALSVSGNRIVAAATGNQAASTIAATR